MDQNAPNGSGKGTWRDKLGLGAKELPRISDQFKEAALADAAKAATRPAVKPPQPVAKPAPMAPRPGAAKVAPPPAAKPAQPTTGGALVDRLKAQREAAERLAEQRIASARQKAEGAAPAVPLKNGNGAAKSPPEKPKFSFADDDANETKESAEQKSVVSKTQTTMPTLGAKPAAEPPPRAEGAGEAQPKPTVQPKLSLPLPPLAQGKPQLGAAVLKPGVLPSQRGLSGGQTTPIMPPRPQLGTAMPPPGFKPIQPQVPPFELRPLGPKPPAYPPSGGQQGFRPIDPPGYPRSGANRGYAGPTGYTDPSGLTARRDAYESYRRQQPQPPAEELPPNDEGVYQDEPQLGPPPRRALRQPGAAARGRQQAYDDEMGEVFEDDAPPPGRRRANAQDYSRAYREYEEHGQGEEPRRSLWPWILMLALLLATALALAGTWYYMNYMRAPETVGGATTGGKVVTAPEVEDKTRSFKNSGSDTASAGTEQNSSGAEAAAEPEPAVPAATKKKRIYLRIIGEQSVDGATIVPTEEPPVAPSDTNTQGGSAEPAPPAASGESGGEQGAAEQPPAPTGQTGDPAAVPDPLPVPPVPGSGGTQGAIDGGGNADAAEIQPAGAPPEDEEKPAPTQGEVLVLNAEQQPAEEPKTRSFGAVQTGKDTARLTESGTTELALKQPDGGAATTETESGTIEAKQAELPPSGAADGKAEVVEIRPAQNGGTDEIVAATDAAPLDAPVPGDTGDTGDGKEAKDVAALEEDAADAEPDPAAKSVDEPVVKKQAAEKAAAKKPRQKAAAAGSKQGKVPRKKAKAEETATATLDGADEPAAAAQQTEDAPVADGPLESAEAAPPKKRSFLDLFRRKPAEEQAGKNVASAEPPPPAKKRAEEPAPAAGSGFGVQLGVFRTEAEARAEINRLQVKHGSKVAGMQARVGRTQVAGSTRFRAGFSGAQNRGEADQVCSQLRAAGERDCVVRRQ